MTSPYHIRQSNSRQQGYLSRSIETNQFKSPPCITNNTFNYNNNNNNNNNNNLNTLGLEYASFDSTRTDLSASSRDVIIGEQWAVLGRIGEGSFGEVFEAEDIDTGRHYAIKREPLKMHHPQIKHESDMYDVLAGGPGIPQCHWHGQHEGFDCIVIDLLGPNLNQLREATKNFSIEVVADFGCQMITILEHVHKCGLVYRDIKPDNFLFPSKCFLPEAEMVEIADDHGMPHIKYISPTIEEVFKKWNETNPKLYIVDFGLTTWWKNPTTNQPFPEIKKNIRNKTGTARYASLNVHRGKSHSRRDDVESIGYLLLDLLFGTLPWTGIQARNSKAGWDRMRQIKEDTFMSDLCAGLPQGFLNFIEYSRKIRFNEEPNYNLLREFLNESIHGGKYSSIVKSPFGGHTERKWTQEIHQDQSPPQKKHEEMFNMDDLANNLPQKHNNTKKTNAMNSNNTNNRRKSKDLSATVGGAPSSFQKLVAKNKRKQKRVGWNSHKHDQEPWIPATDWETNPTPNENSAINTTAHASWGDNNPAGIWGDNIKEEKEQEWAASVKIPWES